MLQAGEHPRLFLGNGRLIIGMEVFQLQIRRVCHRGVIHPGIKVYNDISAHGSGPAAHLLEAVFIAEVCGGIRLQQEAADYACAGG